MSTARRAAPALPAATDKARLRAAPEAAAASAVSLPSAPRQRHNLALLLLQAREAVMQHFRPLLHAHGLTEQQWRILRALADAGMLEPRQIVARCCISSPSLAGVLARMVAQGLVQRDAVAHDARRVSVRPSAQGQALVRQMAPLVEAAYGRIEQQLGTGDMAALYAALDALLAHLPPPDEAATGPAAASTASARSRRAVHSSRKATRGHS